MVSAIASGLCNLDLDEDHKGIFVSVLDILSGDKLIFQLQAADTEWNGIELSGSQSLLEMVAEFDAISAENDWFMKVLFHSSYLISLVYFKLS